MLLIGAVDDGKIYRKDPLRYPLDNWTVRDSMMQSDVSFVIRPEIRWWLLDFFMNRQPRACRFVLKISMIQPWSNTAQEGQC